MFTKIIFIVETLFNRRDYNRFGVQTFLDRGYDVEVWDLSRIIYPHTTQIKAPDPINVNLVKNFKSYEEVLDLMGTFDGNVMVLNFLTYQFKTIKFFETISKRKIFHATNLAIGSLPTLSMDYLTMDFAQDEYNEIGIRGADLILAGGTKSLRSNFPVGKHTRTVRAHTNDYDLFLDIKSSAKGKASDIVVFLDEYLPFHPDFVQMGVDAPDNAHQYYDTLNSFFDIIEDKMGVPVVIAAHPRSHYHPNNSVYQNRQIVQFSTPGLINRAKLVLLHASTAVNFAVLFKKPCLFITTDRIEMNINYSAFVYSMAITLRRKVINADTVNKKLTLNLKQELCVNHGFYEEYVKKYIKFPNTPEKKSWDIFCDYLKSNYQP